MSENAPVFIDNIEDSVVYARRGDGTIRVFYDLSDMMQQYMKHHVSQVMSADTDLARARCLGANDVLTSLNDSLAYLAAEAESQRQQGRAWLEPFKSQGSFDGVEYISDLFPDA